MRSGNIGINLCNNFFVERTAGSATSTETPKEQ